MPILVKNGRVYSSTSSGSTIGGGSVEMTQAQYDALENPDPNIIYFITDGDANSDITASGIEYDNTDSGMAATTVQSALDELSGGLTTLDNKYYYRDYAFTLSYSGGTIGTRGAQGYFALDSDAIPVSTIITYVSSSDRFIPIIFTSTSSGANPAIYCNLYRCDTNSLSSALQVNARVLYRRN